MTKRTVAGVDWAGGQWLAVVLEDDSYGGCYLEEEYVSLWETVPAVDEMLVDVPIGLPQDEASLRRREELDSKARSITGRPSSVFPVPCKQACELAGDGDEYEQIAAKNESVLEKGLPKQSSSIARACGEVDDFLAEDESLHDTVIESHPEVCFRGLSDSQLQYSKNCAAGLGERLEIIEGRLDEPGSKLRRICAEIPDESNGEMIGDVTVDDVVDAFGLAVTAWKRSDWSDELRPDGERSDSSEPPMRMAYWSKTPLDPGTA